LAQRVRGAFPEREIHLILENDANEARYLARDTDGRPRVYSAQWNDDLHHAWHVMLTGETEGYYSDYHGDPVSCLGRALAEGFAYQGETSAHRGGASRGEVSRTLPPAAFVAFLQNHDQIGNRAMGERLGHLVARERVALARAVLLLAPQIPLLFMGEEWDASTLFLYFVDFEREPDLARAVREGRRKEFAGFAAFEDAAKRDEIPDPGDPATMARSVLNWRERRDHPHSAVLDETRKLLRLRQAEIVPLLAGAFRGASYAKGATDALEVAWRFGGGRLRLALNFDEAAYRCAIEPRERLLWGSPALVDERAVMALPPWSGALLKSEEG
jgi:maltooligosyltrehalose trehalohydrolase